MPDLEPVTPFGDTAPRKQAVGLFRLSENTGHEMASLALRRGTLTPSPENLGLLLPGPGRFSEGAGRTAIWTGPGQWMIEQRDTESEGLVAWLKQRAPGCSITDQSDAWAGVTVEAQENAAAIEALLERLVNIDVRTFLPGAATRTLSEHMSVIVVRRSTDRITVFAMRSLAGSLWHALETKVQRLELEAVSAAGDR